LRKNLLHFVRAAHERGIGDMPTMQYKFDEWKDKAAWPNARDFVAVPDREDHVTDAVTKNRKWLADANTDWGTGLDLAEASANLLG
jgi:hypothetical protein